MELRFPTATAIDYSIRERRRRSCRTGSKEIGFTNEFNLKHVSFCYDTFLAFIGSFKGRASRYSDYVTSHLFHCFEMDHGKYGSTLLF